MTRGTAEQAVPKFEYVADVIEVGLPGGTPEAFIEPAFIEFAVHFSSLARKYLQY